ncbi:MAG: hypothetical protein RLZZ427_1359 [Pseudomonadota bacterium]|jgi:hypothetical protein
MTDPNRNGDLLADAKDEIVGMAKQGMKHPSTAPVLTGAAIGGVAGLLLPLVSIPLGAVIGASFTLYKRLRP